MERTDSIGVGELEIHPREHCALFRGEPVPLTAREFDILTVLAEHPGWTYSASQLCDAPVDAGYSPESVSVLVSRLRHKLSSVGAFELIETVRGVGYRLPAAVGGAATDRRGPNHELRDAVWVLHEAVIEAENLGTVEQQHEIADTLEQARRAVYASLAK